MAYKLSGQITVATAGTEEQGPDVNSSDGFFIRALITNTGKIYIGNNGDGTVSSSTGYELSPGDQVFINVKNLSEIWVDSTASGDKACWLCVGPRSG